MKHIFKIAKLELSLLFYSPIAWIILIIFLIQTGLSFTDLLDARETSQQLGNELMSLTMDIFGTNKGFFAAVQNKLYLYIPLLTMGLMSKEISSGSIKLLYSSPITNLEIILGKFLSMMLYGLIPIIVLVLIIFIGSFSIEALDIKFLLGGLFGLYLLICAYSAIGLYMSSLTPYQVVAAISTLAVLAALEFVGTIGQSIDFVRDITYWISISGRADNFINGLISSKDVIYFLLVIFLFLSLTVIRLNNRRVSNKNGFKALKYTLLVVVVIAIGYTSSLPFLNGYYDTTRFKTKTLTPTSQHLISELEEPIKIQTYVNVVNSFAHLGSPKFRIFDLSKFDKYTRFIPELQIEYTIYYDSTYNARDNVEMSLDDRGKRAATAYGFDFEKVLRPKEIRSKIDLKPENNVFVRKVEYKDRSTSLRMFYDMIGYPEEAEISAAIKRLLTKPSTIGILDKNYERSINKSGDKDYQAALNTPSSRYSLINQGFDVIPIDINKTLEIADSLSVLVIADPLEPYSEEAKGKIINYIKRGGNILIAAEPGKRDYINPLLKEIGIKLKEGVILQKSDKVEYDVLPGNISTQEGLEVFNLKEDDIISFKNAATLEVIEDSAFHYKSIIRLDKEKAWVEKSDFNIETDTLTRPEEIQKDSLLIGAMAERKLNGKTQKIMVFGDADFMSNGELNRFNLRTKNFEFVTQIFKWFSDGEYPVNVQREHPIDNKILVSRGEITVFKILLVGILPFILALSGIIILVKRKRK